MGPGSFGVEGDAATQGGDAMLGGFWRRIVQPQAAWWILALVASLAVWHALDFSDSNDLDFPEVVRPWFSLHPPASYRLAEPGDTLDRVALYLSAGCLMITVGSLRQVARSRPLDGEGGAWALWPAALALSLAATWYAATPGPCFDGWTGLGWRTILDPGAPGATRLALLGAALGLVGVVAANVVRAWPERRAWLAACRSRRVGALLALAGVLIVLRQVEWPGLAPVGYWPRCGFDLGMLALGLALLRARPVGALPRTNWGRLGVALGWLGVVAAGITVAWLHRPLARLHPVVPGRIYISAMPTYRGLSVEQERLHFRTIINLFDEASTQASPRHADELAFVREHGLRYLGSPSDGLESDGFLDETLALAQDPNAWPILVHCHGCMDRSPAWMGIYRFLVQGTPLASIYQEIEQHRGTRPKAVVTLQYARKLARRAPDRWRDDPATPLLQRAIAAVTDATRRLEFNPIRTTRQVVRRIDPDPTTRRP